MTAYCMKAVALSEHLVGTHLSCFCACLLCHVNNSLQQCVLFTLHCSCLFDCQITASMFYIRLGCTVQDDEQDEEESDDDGEVSLVSESLSSDEEEEEEHEEVAAAHLPKKQRVG